MIKAIIFDLGFTLVGNENFSVPEYLKMLDRGIDKVANYLYEVGTIEKEDINKFTRKFKKVRYQTYQRVFSKYVEYSTEFCFEKTFELLNIDYDQELLNKVSGIFHVTESDFWTPFPGTKKTLETLKNMDLKIALLSNGPYDRGIKTLLEMHGLKEYFNLIETSANIGYTKPDPITFNTVLKQLNTKPDETVMVGDDLLNDCKGASDVGMRCIKVKKAFDFPYEKELEFQPDFIIENINEVPTIIKKINNNS